MGYKLASRVYGLDKELTSPSEQAVLLALAFRAKDETLPCYPKQETLVRMTHLSRSAVAAALNALREKNLISWQSGGLRNKKGRFGRTLATDCTLNLPDEPQKNASDVEESEIQPLPPICSRPAVRVASDSKAETSPLLMALRLCGLKAGTQEYGDNYRAFSSVTLKIGMERSMEIVRTIASEERNGELDGIKSLPRFVMARLKACVDK